MFKVIPTVCTGLFILFSVVPQATLAAPVPARQELIQIAVLLDTSGSMDGLIGQAKSTLWKMVNELALARRNGQSPRLEVALFEYGNNSLSQQSGYIRQILGLTADLDKVSEELFKLVTNGGDEFCGQVIGKAADALAWNSSTGVLKMIFIAGNEPFTQGAVSYNTACKKAIAKGIIVNTIFCGDFQEGIDTQWKQGADLADGKYMNIDQNRQTVAVNAPQDDEIMKLGLELNTTYIAYGSAGKQKKEMQAEQDRKAVSLSPEAAVQRSLAKAAPQYNAGYASADLINAAEADPSALDKADEEQLPEEMKRMTPDQRKQYVAEKSKKREEIRKKLDKLNLERRKYVEAETKKLSGKDTLDQVMLKTVREQAVKKNFAFGE